MNRFLTVLLVLSCLSCQKKEEKVKPAEVSTKDTLAVKQVFLKKSARIVDDWAEIVALEGELKKLGSQPVKSVKDIELLKEAIQKLKESCPERFKTMAIQTRIKVLETEFAMLEQDVKEGYFKDIAHKTARLQTAYNIFVDQIEAFILKEKDYETYK